MAIKPNTTTLNANSVDIVNAIQNEASPAYQAAVPAVNESITLRAVGEIITSSPIYMNEFLDALVNRIGRVIINSKMFSNPWAIFKGGYLEYGETVEEIFVNLAKPFNYDIDSAETTVFKKEIPDVQAAFHRLNYRKFYKVTVTKAELRQAFLNADGVTSLISTITDQLYNAARYDEFLVMKYMILKGIVDGKFFTIKIDRTNTSKAVTTIRKASNDLTFPAKKFNHAGVLTKTDREKQYLFVSNEFDSKMDVEVLASAFNMNKAEFLGHKILIDSFAEIDEDRLSLIFKDDPGYLALTSSDFTALANIEAVIVDADWFKVYDNTDEFDNIYNPQGMYWNYFYHQWKLFSTSPFNTAIAFSTTNGLQGTALTVTPATTTAKAGGTVQLSYTHTATVAMSNAVNWTVSPAGSARVLYGGRVQLSKSLKKGDTVTVAATNVQDGTNGKCVITIS